MKISVMDFSCLKYAEVELRPLTFIIGPQSSGKSLIAKIQYFFIDSLLGVFATTSFPDETPRNFSKRIEVKFIENFPPATWGKLKFEVSFSSGPISICVRRKSLDGAGRNRVSVEISEFLKRELSARTAQFRKAIAKKSSSVDHFERDVYYPEIWDSRTRIMRSLIDRLGSEFPESQFFIPAGRSFYSSLGRAVAMLEHGSNLDETTKRFGRRFTGMLDGVSLFLGRREGAKLRANLKLQKSYIDNLLGGNLKLRGSDKHLEMFDGRIIPMPLMSSGQQELVPLLLTLQEHHEHNFSDKDLSVDVLYIEEPEAHLFPKSQSELMKFIILINRQTPKSRMLITTHSPYVLSTINNCLLAGYTARSGEVADKVKTFVDESIWLEREHVSAYSIDNGRCLSIMNEDGLIEASYLDSVSFEISDEFSSLLDLGYSSDAV